MFLGSIPHLFIFFLLLWSSTGTARPSQANEMNDDVMSCAICNIVVEAMMVARTPAKALALAYRRCGRMGLMEPVCDQMIERNAKQFLEIAINNESSTTKAICSSLRLCDM